MSTNRFCCCGGLECRTEGLYSGCSHMSVECMARFAICVADETYPGLDTDPPAIMTRVVDGEYEYVLAGVKKFNLVLTRTSTSTANPELKCYVWNVGTETWDLVRTLGSNPFTGLGTCSYGDGWMDYGGGTVHYRIWALDPWHFETITASASGVNFCTSNGDRCEVVYHNGNERIGKIVAMDISGTPTLTADDYPANYVDPGKCIFWARHGTVDLEVYGYQQWSDCNDGNNLIAELTLDVMWRIQIDFSLGGNIAVSVALFAYSDEPTDNFGVWIFQGLGDAGSDSLDCAGQSVVVSNESSCFDIGFGSGGTITVNFPARGT